MKILLHVCCGPCLIYPADVMRGKGHEITAFFYNPNIHPYSEFNRRRDSLLTFCKTAGLPVEEGPYDYKKHLEQTIVAGDGRCGLCYRMRLESAAWKAAKDGYDAFSTTLLVSPYQRHEEIITAGGEAAAAHGVDFYYEDWREGFKAGREKAREMNLYSQKYCGCVYSEEERFTKR